MKFPQGEGSVVIHRKKNRPALQRHDSLTVSLVILLISAILRAHFSNFSQGFFMSSTVLFFFLVLFFLAGLYCLLRMYALTSCVGDT